MLVHPHQGCWGGVPLVGAGGVHAVGHGADCGGEGKVDLVLHATTECVPVCGLLLLLVGVPQLLPVQDQPRVPTQAERVEGFLCVGDVPVC